jgi:hypothetical protein
MPRLPFTIDDALWRFNTKHLSMCFFATPEDLDPADAFQFEEDIEAVRSSAVEWFTAWVVVYGPNEEVLGYDVLGGCAYKNFSDFYGSRGDYFTDMVTHAASEARTTILAKRDAYGAIHVRA